MKLFSEKAVLLLLAAGCWLLATGSTAWAANPFSNPGMEAGVSLTTGSLENVWQPMGNNYSSAIYTWDATVSHSGTHSLKVQGVGNVGDGNPAGWTQFAPCTPGVKYSTGVWVLTQSAYSPGWIGGPSSVTMNISFLDSGLNGVGGTYGIAAYVTDSMRTLAGWTYLPIADVVTPAGASFISIGLGGVFQDTSIIWFDDVVCNPVSWAGVVRPTQLFQKSASSVVWAEHQNADVLQTDAAPSGSVPGSPLQLLTAVQGERTAFQLVVQPIGTGWTNTTITQGSWSGPSAAPGSVEVDHVLYVSIPAAVSGSNDRGGLIPDPMPVEQGVTLAAGVNSPWMINVDVPLGTTPGVYICTFSVNNNGTLVASVPVQLTVLNCSIPATPTFWNIGNINGSLFTFEDPANNKNHVQIIKNYINNCKIYRCNPGGAYAGLENQDADPPGSTGTSFSDSLSGSTVTVSGLANSETLWAYMARLGMADWPVRGNFGGAGGAWVSLGFAGQGGPTQFTDSTNTQYTSAFANIATQQLTQIQAARKSQGLGPWLYYFNDEVGDIYTQPGINSYKTMINFMKSIDPTIRFCMAAVPSPQLIPYVDFVARVDNRIMWTDLDHQQMSQNMAGIYPNSWAGPQRSAIKYRLWMWAAWNTGYRGVLWWALSGWTQWGNPSVTNPWDGNFEGPTMLYPPRCPIVVRGTLTPNVAGTFTYAGMAKGRLYYQNGTEYLSSDGTNWFISNAIGGAGTGAYWQVVPVNGAYTPVGGGSWNASGGATGTLTTAYAAASENGPISSTRWAAVRQGLQDVELFQKLQTLINNLRGIASSTDLTNAASALAAVGTTASHVPQGLNGDYWDEFGTYDYAAIETVRTNVINSIITLEGYPTAHPQKRVRHSSKIGGESGVGKTAGAQH